MQTDPEMATCKYADNETLRMWTEQEVVMFPKQVMFRYKFYYMFQSMFRRMGNFKKRDERLRWLWHVLWLICLPQ